MLGNPAARIAESEAETFGKLAKEWRKDSDHGEKRRKTKAYGSNPDVYRAAESRNPNDIAGRRPRPPRPHQESRSTS